MAASSVGAGFYHFPYTFPYPFGSPVTATATATASKSVFNIEASLQATFSVNNLTTLRSALVDASLSSAATLGASYLMTVKVDAPQTITATLSSVVRPSVLIDSQTTITASFSPALLANANVDASQPIAFTTTSALNGLLNAVANTLAVTDNQNASGRGLYSAAATLQSNFEATAPIVNEIAAAADLAISAIVTLTAGETLSALISADRGIAVATTAGGLANQFAKSSPSVTAQATADMKKKIYLSTAPPPALAVTATSSSIPQLDRGVQSPLTVTVDAPSSARASLIASGNTMPGLPYVLPFGLGFLVNTFTASARTNAAYAGKIVSNIQSVAVGADSLLIQYGNVESLLSVGNGSEANINQNASLDTQLTTAALPNAAAKRTQSFSTATNGFFVFAAGSRTNTRIGSSLNVFVGTPNFLSKNAKISANTAAVATITAAANVDFVGIVLPVAILTWLSSDVHRNTVAQSNTEIIFDCDSDDSDNRPIDSSTFAYANILTELTRTQYISSELEVVASPELSVRIDWSVNTTLEVSAHRPIEIRSKLYCEAALEVTAMPEIFAMRIAYIEAHDLILTVTITSPENFKTIYINSNNSPIIVSTEAKGEMYHAAGSFVPFFYAGSLV
jgi:hypothetical protein